MIVPRDPHEPLTRARWDALAAAYPVPHKIRIALRLARDLEACRDLLAGVPVDPSRLHRAELEWAKRKTLVQLVAPLDLLERAA